MKFWFKLTRIKAFWNCMKMKISSFWKKKKRGKIKASFKLKTRTPIISKKGTNSW